jgi:hypothetical protein
MSRSITNAIAIMPLSAGPLVACDAWDSLRYGLEHSQAVSADLEKSPGMKSIVGFSWNNEQLTAVTVDFEGLPYDRPLEEFAEHSKKAVLRHFKQQPKQLAIALHARIMNGRSNSA